MRLKDQVWRPSFEAFKYNGEYKIKNSDFSSNKTKTLQKLNYGMWTNTKWIKELNRNIKSFVISKFVYTNNKVLSMTKRVNFKNFKKFYGINKTSRIVGYTPDYIGSSVSKVVDAHNHITDFISYRYRALKHKLSKDCLIQLRDSLLDERVVISAGFDSSSPHLKEFLKDNSTESTYTVKSIFKILALSNFKWFKSPRVNFSDGIEIFTNVKINLNSFAGHYTSMIFGRKKIDSVYPSQTIAYNIWRLLKKRPIKNTFLWSILGREKDSKISIDEDKELSTRVVMTCESPMIHLLCWFAQKMSTAITSSEINESRLNVSGNFDAHKATRLINKSYDYDFILEADWTFYDSNIDTNFLKAAGLILCSGFPDDKLHRNIRYLIISSIVTKYVAIPPGVVVELNRAQPSGHPFGTLVNCYVNIIYWCLIGQKIYGDEYHKYMDIEVYGDDTRAYFKYHENLININQYVSECSLKSDDLLPNFRCVNEDSGSRFQIDYLKRRFDYTGMKWNHKKMFDKLIYQSKNRKINDQFLLVKSWYDSVPSDEDAFHIQFEFSKYIKNNHLLYKQLDESTKNDLEDILSNEEWCDSNIPNEFTYGYVVDYKINMYTYEINRLNQQYVFKCNTLNSYNDYNTITEEYTKLLAITGIVPHKKISRELITIGIFGVPPPVCRHDSNFDNKYKKLIKIKIDRVKRFLNNYRNNSKSSEIYIY